jgi:prepilin-type N-terminal cleavage/methylation domain-containing protein
MPQFRYRAVTHAGEIVAGEVDASSREEVVRRIEYLGHLTIDAKIAATWLLNRGRSGTEKLPRSRDVSIFLRRLSLLVGTAAVILLFFLIYLVPQFEPVFKDLGGRLNSGAALIVAASIWLRANVDLLLGICLSLVLCAWLRLSRRARRPGSAEMAAISRDRKCGVGLRSGHHRRNDTARQAGAMKMQKRRRFIGCDGFTLVEVLAALAIASVIIMASAALIHNVALFFDRGTRGVTEAERLMLAVERLAGDFGSARFVWRRTEDGAAAAFAADQASSERPASITFVGAGRAVSTPRVDDDLINLIIEEEGEVRRLVRRRATWPGPRARFEDVVPQDPVVLIEGRLDISFVFGRVTPDGALAWYASWAGERVLPRYVRLILRDRATGADLLGEADFMVRANAPAACGRADAGVACLTAAPPVQTDPSEAERFTR